MHQQEPGCDAEQLKHVENNVADAPEALSQSKGTDMAVQPRRKKSVSKKLKASTKKGEKCTTISQEKPLSKVGHVAEGTEHMFRTHICSECRRCFKTRSHLIEHMRIHFPDPSLQCPTCKHYFTSKSKLRIHMLRETGQKLHRCHLCEYRAVERNSLRRHLSSVHGHQEDDAPNGELFKCPTCQKTFSQSQALKSHMKSHNKTQNEQPLFCFNKGCSFQCTEKKQLQKHVLDAHQIEAVECRHHACGAFFGSLPLISLRYKCNQCPYRCHRIDQLNSHKLRHQEKSLICEVCAYSCKRKTELRSHMQLKHSTNADPQPPVYQCKFCPYTTKYRQALHSHENCRHTRTRMFRCALCRYTTFSNTSLFLHKKKSHGYVPGDVGWLEKYAEKEKEQSSADLTHNFFSKTTVPQTSNSEYREETVNTKESNRTIDDSKDMSVNENENDAIAATIGGPEEMTLVQQASLDIESAREEASNLSEGHPTDEGQCGSPLFASQTSQSSTQMVLAETVNIHDTTFDFESHTLHTVHQNFPQLSADDDDDDDNAAYCEEQSDSEDLPPVTETERSTEGLHQEKCVEASATETRLQFMRKQDKDQAEALVLEGRVQMLVVQTRGNMYQCSRCSYVTRKQAALIRHCKSSCQVMKAGLRCQDCGMQFKQQRSLNTHLRKCRSLQRRRKKFDFASTVGTSGSCVGSSGSDASIQEQSASLKSGSLTMHPELVDITDSKDSRVQGSAEPEGSLSPTITAVVNETDSLTGTTKGGQATVESRNKLAEEELVNDEISGYTEDNGRYTCRKCPFSSIRKVTIDRHCAACSGSTHKVHLAETGEQFEQEDNPSDSDHDQEEDGANDSERDSGEEETPQNPKPRFSCPNCPFLCHQKRALTSHQIKGCLKPGEIQCPQCSFVAKSEKSLNHHILGHEKNKKVTRGKISRNLQCNLCSFTCKQDRCLAQHVAVKHEGVRPHQCRFCSFSTIRRYRLEAHESMHTGVGRHSCELCGQTFGTTSRLRLHHQRIHDKQATHFCSLCDYRAYNLNDINRHNLSCHTGDLSYHCSQCNARFSSEVALRQHSNRAHPDANSLSCSQCSFTCSCQAALKAHLQHEHSEIKTKDPQNGTEKQSKISITHQCLVCSFSTHKKLLLVQHMLDEHEDGPAEEKTLKCDVCGFSCTHQVVFDQHVRSHGGTCLFKCTECEFSTRNKQKITWHIRIHTGEKPYRCEKCSYACADPSRLKYHMRIHMEERKYLCPECGYKCKWVNQLKYHMTKHTGAKPYACEDCEYRTNRADALRIHRETRHRDVRSFICEKCGKAFKTRFLLKTHQRKHSEERPYVCSICQRAFRWPAGLRHHYLSHTNQLPFYCLHCTYRAKQKFQVVKHLKRHHPDLPVQDGVGKDQEASSKGTQKTWIREEEERQEKGGDM